MKPDLSVIVVNYNATDYLERCLESIRRQTGVVHQTIVVDNASLDGGVEMIARRFPWVFVIANEHNAGFAAANNQALSHCRSRYILFLNPDTEVLDCAFARLVDYMEANRAVGLAGCRLVNPDGSPQSSTEERYPGQKYAAGELKGLKGGIAWVMGAAMVADAELINALKGFDERFFIYGEDADLCLRVRKAGMEVGFINDAVVVHWGGRSERGNEPLEVYSRKFAAEMLFFRTHYSEKAFCAIRRAHLIKALWRIVTIRLALPFMREKRGALTKLSRYRHVMKVLRNRYKDTG
jgi:N-acetylglucosaminyl-diphospho-decaprenol L-rhamnosyltransferase